jgi:hypothetical protein
MEYITTTYGLTGEYDPTSENGQLFLVDYIFLLGANDRILEAIFASDVLKTQIDNSKTGIEGLYHRNALLTTRTLSHDNLSAIFAWSYATGSNHRFEIWKYLVKHLGTYDNTQGTSTAFSRHLPFNPANFFAWGLCSNSILAYLFFPIFLINLIISSNKPKNDVSGKILAFVEMYPLQKNLLVKLCYKYYTNKMTKMYGENYHYEIRKIYHGGNSAEFPINKLLGINNG